jgi:hypothetical protein
VVFPSLSAAFTAPAGYGDFVAGTLTIEATLPVAKRASWDTAHVRVFNVWGAGDLLNAIYQGNVHAKIDAGTLRAAFYIPTAIVPPLLVTHALIFLLLLLPKAS